MKTNDILLKFQNNKGKLETVLNKKNFSGDVKNLLLNMLYNITSAYNDYARVKVNVEEKNKYIENIISIIEQVNSIEIIKPMSEEGKKYTEKGIRSEVNTYFKDIKTMQTEKDMLFALFKLNDTKMYLDEKYHLLRVSIPEMLNEGRDINNIEIIRDFNAWSWNTLNSEISNIDCNLIYQNLQILLGFKFLDEWMNQGNGKGTLEKLEKELKDNYDEINIEKLLKYIYKLSIIICIQRNQSEKERLLEEKEWNEKELERLKDKVKLVETMAEIKKQTAKEIKKIDKIINDDELLKKEFEKRNKKLSEYKKIFSLENLLGTLKKERKKCLKEIEDANRILDAKNYVNKVNELEQDLELLKEVKGARNKERYKIRLQKLFIKCLEENIYKISNIEQAKQAISLLHIIRYYKYIPFDENKFIKDIEDLKEEISKIEGKMLLNLYEAEIINPLTKDIETDIGIMKPIFETRIIDLENIVIQISKQGDRILVKLYDGNILELEYTIQNLNNVNIKGKKKIKLFAK